MSSARNNETKVRIKIKEKKTSFLNDKKIEFRDYQVRIAKKCANKNSLVVLPTGLGKTVIAVIIAAKSLEASPPSSKVIVLAPTRPLINQHYDSFANFLNVPEEKFSILTGKIAPEKRKELHDENSILFYTPQTLRNDLVKKRYGLEDACLVIFDEAHHASGDYPYGLIADEFADQNPDGVILALTASPGSTKKKIAELCEQLHVPVENIHIRSRKDNDVKIFLKPMDVYKIGVDLTSLMKDVYFQVQRVLEERLQYLSQLGFLPLKSDKLCEKIIRKDLLKLNSELINIIKGSGDKTGSYSAISINAQALILYHMIELIEQQGLNMLLKYLEKMYKDAKKRNSSKAVKMLAIDRTLNQVHLELKKKEHFSPEKLIHPKYAVLEKIILDELKKKITSKILVFVKLRASVASTVNKLKKIEEIKPVRFVGQATKSKDDKGLSQKRQIEILEQFKEGSYNVLVSTNVGEEGLDIAECDLVIFYDVVASEIRLIQRKGRTARHREGKVVILYCRDTHDEVYLRIALSKLKKMNVNLKNRDELKKYFKAKKTEKIEKMSNNIIEKSIKKDFIEDNTTTTIKTEVLERKRQSNLISFIYETEKKRAIKKIENKKVIKLSNLLPMKFGLRKKLRENDISFQATDSKLHIEIFSNVKIQVFNPLILLEEKSKLISFIRELKKKYKLVITIFDFIEFEPKFDGEKQLFKQKITEFGKKNGFQVVIIDNTEELFFIVKSIYEHGKDKVI
ncbi:MAG: DEAD/DEAH box helicase [Promethearchaeota archaeon]